MKIIGKGPSLGSTFSFVIKDADICFDYLTSCLCVCIWGREGGREVIEQYSVDHDVLLRGLGSCYSKP